MALTAGENSLALTKKLDTIVNSLPNHLSASEQLNDDNEKTLKDVNQSNKQCKISFTKSIVRC